MSPARAAGLHSRIDRTYREGTATLATSKDDGEVDGFREDILRRAMRKMLREGGLSETVLRSGQVRALVDEYARLFNVAIGSPLETDAIPYEMARKLREDVFLFSGFKTYAELREAASMLTDDAGRVKSFDRFYSDISAIREDYNRNWLRSEYVFATSSAQMAAKWKELEADGDRYMLQYRTANDGKVRAEHRALHNVTLPVDDPFWDEFYPPNGWRCRCTVVRVRKGKYPESDSATAIQQGREATYRPNKRGENRDAIFRFNPGKRQVIFPPHHPYYEVSQRERELVERMVDPVAEHYTTIPTERGKVRVHDGHGKGERQENIRVATYLANKHGYEIDLLDNPDGDKSADSYNRSIDRIEEYKVNSTPSKSSIDNLLRKAKDQADHVVLWIESDISLGDLRAAIYSRVKRSDNIKTVTIVIGGRDCTYTREQIVKDGFIIKQADLK